MYFLLILQEVRLVSKTCNQLYVKKSVVRGECPRSTVTLHEEFYQDASFGANEAGYLRVTLEPAVIEQRFLELVRNSV